jgi:hypothetical protein
MPTTVYNEQLQKLIYEIRGQKVMLDSDLAALYGVELRSLNQAVKRNIGRFPLDFMFQLTNDEWDSLGSQIVTSNNNDEDSLRSQNVISNGNDGGDLLRSQFVTSNSN